MALVNKSEQHFRKIKGYLEEQGLSLVKRLTDISPEAAIATISEGQYDIDILIAREMDLMRAIDPISGLTVPNPNHPIVDCGADYLGINLNRDQSEITQHHIIPTKAPCFIDNNDIGKHTIYLIPNGVTSSLEKYAEQLREFVFISL